MIRRYTIKEAAILLGVPYLTVLELKKRYGIKHIDNDSLSFLKMIVAKINLKYGRCTLTTIDRYMNRGGSNGL